MENERPSNTGRRPQGNTNRNRNDNRKPRPQGQPQRPAQGQQQERSGKPAVSRGAAVRAQKRSQMDAQRIANQFMPAQVDENMKRRANYIDDSPQLRIIGLGGMDG